MTSLADSFQRFRLDLYARADTNSKAAAEEFMYYVTDKLISAGEIEGFEYCYCTKPQEAQINGYDYTEDGVLFLFVADFEDRDELKNINQAETKKIIGRALRFFSACLKSDYYKGFEETSPEYILGRLIWERRNDISKVSLYLLSERNLRVRTKRAITAPGIQNISVDVHIWDMPRIIDDEPVVIYFKDLIDHNLPCLPVASPGDDCQYYLTVLPGVALAGLYDKFGSRLLENNVRCFLQARGKVNKGIIETIKNSPQMFFAYNNGISATAESVEVKRTGDNLLELESVKELQIVNGGQTTASLLYAKRKFNADLSNVSVQMKLSIVPGQISETVVPNISKYANTQNRIVDADFDSNHPFQIKYKHLSKQVIAPPVDGNLYGTYWFYERARGQYADAQTKLTPALKKKFQADHPKSQLITKTDLGKYENVWFGHPVSVNKGAQKNFVEFAKRIEREWEINHATFDESFFKKSIARAILFRRTEIMISKQPWYGGYRANIVAYTMAVLAGKLSRQGKTDSMFQAVWKIQAIPEATEKTILKIAEAVNKSIMASAGLSNISEWCKKEACWDRIKNELLP
ncbi:AIPR family protein [Deltaproteobacteria bacterium OttesenSCG-928-K17]|nr:AIPR family protein [Deltaproteobacteria bacterium OttesenSCG-928-K17]